jgi:hypothetical protein
VAEDTGAVADGLPDVYRESVRRVDLEGLSADLKLHVGLGDFTDDLPVSDLVFLLVAASDDVANLDTDVCVRFTERLLEILVLQGAGRSFDSVQQFVRATEEVLNRCAERGAEVWSGYLLLSRFHGMRADGRTGRYRALRAAADAAHRPRAAILCLLHIAQFHIDFSEYSLAVRTIDTAYRIAFDDDAADLLVLIEAHRGIAQYYRSHRRAAAHFAAVLSLTEDGPMTDEFRDAKRLAHHYLGRILAERSSSGPAGLKHLIVSWERYGDPTADAKELGYHHLRVGEVLVRLGAGSQAELHFGLASQAFQDLQEATGLAHLYFARSQFFLRSPDRVDAVAAAESELRQAIAVSTAEGFSRGLVLFNVQLTMLYLRDLRLRPALGTFSAAVRALLHSEGDGLTSFLLFVRSRLASVGGQAKPDVDSSWSGICPCRHHGGADGLGLDSETL